MKKIISVLLLMCFLLSSFAFAESATSQLQEMYAQAELLMATGDYAGAAAKFEAMGAYSDASQMAMYCKAVAAAETMGLYDIAIEAFKNLGDFKDSKQIATYYDGRKNQATADYIIGEDITAVSDGNLEAAELCYILAADTFSGLALFKDCLSRMSDCQAKKKAIDAEQEERRANKYQEALALEQNGEYEDAIKIYEELGNYKDCPARIITCNECIKEEKYQEALALEQNGEYEDAIKAYKKLGNYKDCPARIIACNNGIKEQKYQEALALEEEGKYKEAINIYNELDEYKDSKNRKYTCFWLAYPPAMEFDTIKQFTFSDGVTFGMSSDQVFNKIKQRGYTCTNVGALVASSEIIFETIRVTINDLFANDTGKGLYSRQYSFDASSITEYKENYARINQKLITIFGDPSLSNDTRKTFADSTDLEGKETSRKHLEVHNAQMYSQWYIDFSDNDKIVITHAVSDIGIETLWADYFDLNSIK